MASPTKHKNGTILTLIAKGFLVDAGHRPCYNTHIDTKERMMKEKIGAVAFAAGLLVLMGVAGAVTEFPAEATLSQWITLFGIAFTGGMLAQMGVWMIKDEI